MGIKFVISYQTIEDNCDQYQLKLINAKLIFVLEINIRPANLVSSIGQYDCVAVGTQFQGIKKLDSAANLLGKKLGFCVRCSGRNIKRGRG